MLGPLFGLAAMGVATGAAYAFCCSDPLDVDPTDITYEPLHSADIRIPVHHEQIIDRDTVRFEIHRDDFSGLKFLFSDTIGLYRAGTKKDSACPHINVPKGYLQKEFQPDGIIQITLQLSPTLIDNVIDHGCVITTRSSL